MQPNKFNVVTDGAFGSCAKGATASYLAWKHRPGIISTTNQANAGHSAVNHDGELYIAKALPSPAILRKWYGYQGYNPEIVVGASAAFNIDQLLKEAETCETGDKLWIHPRAGVITAEHKAREEGAGGTKHIGSTMQGCGAFLSDKIMRGKNVKLARDYPELKRYLRIPDAKEGKSYDSDFDPMSLKLMDLMDAGMTMLHEGAQGYSLDIHQGLSYPHCTSRQTTAVQNLADMGLPVRYMGEVYLVIRPYPIRVGNVIEDGKVVGYSGDCYPDQEEITWEQVAASAGMPKEEAELLLTRELTTVTKRLRRVYTYSVRQIREAARVNGATRIAANFVNYVDWECRDTNDRNRITKKVKEFIDKVENDTQIPVTLIGTGPRLNHVIDLESR